MTQQYAGLARRESWLHTDLTPQPRSVDRAQSVMLWLAAINTAMATALALVIFALFA